MLLDSSFWFDAINLNGPLYVLRVTCYILHIKCISFVEDCFVIANSVDPDEMPHYAAFIWVFAVCQRTHLGVTSIESIVVSMPLCGCVF